MDKFIHRKNVNYYKMYTAARRIRDQIKPDNPEARIVSYLTGYAVQYRISGPYYPELESTTP